MFIIFITFPSKLELVQVAFMAYWLRKLQDELIFFLRWLLIKTKALGMKNVMGSIRQPVFFHFFSIAVKSAKEKWNRLQKTAYNEINYELNFVGFGSQWKVVKKANELFFLSFAIQFKQIFTILLFYIRTFQTAAKVTLEHSVKLDELVQHIHPRRQLSLIGIPDIEQIIV